MDNEIKVSIICNTFNQEKYIYDTLESFIKQRTDFNFEVLIHDDASTDGTQDIIRIFEKRYPDIVKPIYQIENQYSKKVSITNTYQLPRAKGEYIAFCEGDDYWIDCNKLQIQVEALEHNKSVDICAHTVKIERNGKIHGKVRPYRGNKLISIKQVILNGGACVGTCSILFRNTINKDMPEFRKKYPMDYTMQIHGAMRGGMLFIDKPMGVYRIAADNSWTKRVLMNFPNAIKHYQRMIYVMQYINNETNQEFDEIIQFVINEFKFKIYCMLDDRKAIKEIGSILEKRNNKEIYKLFGKNVALKASLKYKFPILYKYFHE